VGEFNIALPTMAAKKQLFILIADDDAEDIEMFEDALPDARSRYLIHSVQDGSKLLAFLDGILKKNEPMPALIFLDLNMPVKNGREALEALKDKNSPFRQVPVIMFTTSSQPSDIESCYKCGANLYITKPATFSELKAVLKAALSFFIHVVKLPSPVSHLDNNK
jgi:CheY-like chemotaxis protein